MGEHRDQGAHSKVLIEMAAAKMEPPTHPPAPTRPAPLSQQGQADMLRLLQRDPEAHLPDVVELPVQHSHRLHSSKGKKHHR